jgi:NADH-quinone oxidoreductase subunit M
MLLLCLVVFLTGYMPGLILEYVAIAQQATDLPAVSYILGGVASAGGTLDMIWVSSVLFGGFAVGAVLFYGIGGASRRVHQLDNYAGGHFLTSEVRYQYSDNFYAGLMHHIGPWYRHSFAWGERALSSAVETAGVAMQGFYRQVQPAAWVLVSATLAMAWVIL